jgi:hypothetical protein
MLRYLRIAVTALSLTACVLLIALWVRSYRINEVKAFTAAGIRFHAQSLLGRFVFGTGSNAVSFRQPVSDGLRNVAHRRANRLGFYYFRAMPAGPNDYLTSVCVPHWFLVMIFAGLAAVPWIAKLKRQFSLRTLLITTTLIAVALGIFAVAS